MCASLDYLGVESLYFFLQPLLFFSLFEELLRPLLQGLHNIVLVLLDFLFLFFELLELNQFGFVNKNFVLLFKLCSELSQFVLILSDQCFLVEILINRRLVLDAFRSVSKF